jgi:hypothetical protein
VRGAWPPAGEEDVAGTVDCPHCGGIAIFGPLGSVRSAVDAFMEEQGLGLDSNMGDDPWSIVERQGREFFEGHPWVVILDLVGCGYLGSHPMDEFVRFPS